VRSLYLSDDLAFDPPYALALFGLSALTVLCFQAVGAYSIPAFRSFKLFGLRLVAAWDAGVPRGARRRLLREDRRVLLARLARRLVRAWASARSSSSAWASPSRSGPRPAPGVSTAAPPSSAAAKRRTP
jgi:hypothetical protein